MTPFGLGFISEVTWRQFFAWKFDGDLQLRTGQDDFKLSSKLKQRTYLATVLKDIFFLGSPVEL